MSRVYLAAAYGRRYQLRGYARQLEQTGKHTVGSSWIYTDHYEDTGQPRDLERLETDVIHANLSQDLDDLFCANVLILFTGGGRRGGRHVEFGYAMAFNYRLIIIGERENLFHYLDCVEQFNTWEEFLDAELRRDRPTVANA